MFQTDIATVVFKPMHKSKFLRASKVDCEVQNQVHILVSHTPIQGLLEFIWTEG